MQPINPTKSKFVNFEQVLRWAQSVYSCLFGGIILATGRSADSSGVFHTFDKASGDGIMVRIGSSTSIELVKWDAGTSTVVIMHRLNRIPTGFIITDIDKNATIWRSARPTNTALTLQTSDKTANATVWIF